MKPVQEYLDAFKEAMSGELPFSPSKLKKMLIGLMTEYKRLEEEKKITDKDRENLFSELQKAERRIPELEKYKEFVSFINEYAPDKLDEAKRTATERKNAPKPPTSTRRNLGTFPPFGYVKSAEDKNQWIIDYKAAEIVKEAFKLCIQGYGPTQIARIFTEKGYDTPIIYNRKHGLPTTHTVRFGQEIWSPKSIVGMLSRIEYTGCTANFKTYKSRTSRENA